MKLTNISKLFIVFLVSTMILFAYTQQTTFVEASTNRTLKLRFHNTYRTTSIGGRMYTRTANTTVLYGNNATLTATLSANNTVYELGTIFVYPVMSGTLTLPTATATLYLDIKGNESAVADASGHGLYYVVSINKTTSVAGAGNATIGTTVNATTTQGSCTTSGAMKTFSYPVTGTTVATSGLLKIRVWVGKREAASTFNNTIITMTYDNSKAPSRLELSATDHTTPTVTMDKTTYLANESSGNFEQMTMSLSVANALGGYDIANVSKFYYNITGFSTVAMPNATGGALSLVTGSDTTSPSTYTDVYTYTDITNHIYADNWWTPTLTLYDQSGNTITGTGTAVWLSFSKGSPVQPWWGTISMPSFISDNIVPIGLVSTVLICAACAVVLLSKKPNK